VCSSDLQDPRNNLFNGTGIHPMPHPHMQWGAFWAVNREMVIESGGHEMELFRFRGSDSRMGHRLLKYGDAFYCNRPDFQFHHLGQSLFRQLRDSGHWDELMKITVTPARHYYRQANRLHANGGAPFFSSDAFRELYQEVT
jgi:hypothetical protein